MTMDPIYIVIIFIVVGVASSALMQFASSKTKLKDEALRDHARSKSWEVEYIEDKKHGGRTTKIYDPKDNWVVLSYFNSSTISTTGGANIVEWTEWRCEVGCLAKGAAILGPKLPAKTIKMLNQGATGPLSKVIKIRLFEFTLGLDVDLNECKLLESTVRNALGTILATPGNEDELDFFMQLPVLKEARECKSEMQQAIIYRDVRGTRVRLRKSFRNTKQLDEIVTLGLAIRDALKYL